MQKKTDKGLWFESIVQCPENTDNAVYFVFHQERILDCREGGEWIPLAQEDWRLIAPEFFQEHYMGMLDGQHCFAIDLEVSLHDRQFTDLRSIVGQNDDRLFALAGRATQIISWFKNHQYCGHCGVRTELHPRDRALICPKCGLHFYPRLSPSIIVLVRRGEEVLLARNTSWPEGFYSTLAGFVEPGESVEEALHREVFEEVGIRVNNVRYKGSQPWAFPNSLMIGYHADYESGEFSLQEDEIADAQWFHYKDLPRIPGKIAISRWLIDAYLSEMGE